MLEAWKKSLDVRCYGTACAVHSHSKLLDRDDHVLRAGIQKKAEHTAW